MHDSGRTRGRSDEVGTAPARHRMSDPFQPQVLFPAPVTDGKLPTEQSYARHPVFFRPITGIPDNGDIRLSSLPTFQIENPSRSCACAISDFPLPYC